MNILPPSGKKISLGQVKDAFWVPADSSIDNTVFVKDALTQTIIVDVYPKMNVLLNNKYHAWDKTGLTITPLKTTSLSQPELSGVISDQHFAGKRIYVEFLCTAITKVADGNVAPSWGTPVAGYIGVATTSGHFAWYDDGVVAKLPSGPVETGAIWLQEAKYEDSWRLNDVLGIVIDDTIKYAFFYRNNVLKYVLEYTGSNPKLVIAQGHSGRTLGGVFNFGQSNFKYPDYDNLIHSKDSHPYGSIQVVKTYDSNFKPLYSTRDLTAFAKLSNKLSTYYGVVDDIPHKGTIKLSDFYSRYAQSYHIVTFNKKGIYKYQIPPGCTSFVATIIGAGGGGGAGGVTWESPVDPLVREDGSDTWGNLFKWYPNIAGGGGGGAGEVLDNITILSGSNQTATITIGAGGVGGDSYVENTSTNVSDGKNGDKSLIQVGLKQYTASGGFGGKSPSSWHLNYNKVTDRVWTLKARTNNKSLSAWNDFYGNSLVSGGSPGSNNGLSGSGASGAYFKTYSQVNSVWTWQNYTPSSTAITHVNNGEQTFVTTNTLAGEYAKHIGIGGAGGGNKYFSGGKSGISNTKVAAWCDDYAGVNITTGFITDAQRNGQNGCGGSGGHGASGYNETTWWWDGDITYSRKVISGVLPGLVGKNYSYDVYSTKDITVPFDGTVEIQAWGAGGGGGGWWNNYNYYGGGGRAGQKSSKLSFDVNANDTVNVVIGAGGKPGDNSHHDGYKGGDTLVKINNITKVTGIGGAGGSKTDDYNSNYGEDSDIGIGGRTYWYYNWWWNYYWDWYSWDYYWGYDYYSYYYATWGYYDGWYWPGYWWYCWNTNAGTAAGGAGTHRWWGYYWNDWGTYWSTFSGAKGGNGFAKVTITAYPGNLGNATMARPGGNITFSNGIFPMLKNVTPANSAASTQDIILIGSAVTQSQLTAMGIQTPINQLTVIDPGSTVKIKVSGKVNQDVIVGYWIWNAATTPTTTETTDILYQKTTTGTGFESFAYSNLFVVPTTFDPNEVIVFGLGDRNTKGLISTSFSIITSAASFNPAEFRNERLIASQDGADGGDGYVKISAWNYTNQSDNYFIVPIGVSTLKITIGTVNVTVSNLTPSETLRVYRSGISNEHSFVTRDMVDGNGGIITLLTGVDTGGKENIKIELV